MAEEPAERVEQRQGVGKAGQCAVADMHPDVATAAQERAEDLSGQRRGHAVDVEPLERHITFLQPHGRPDLSPERHGAVNVGEMLRRGLGQQVRPEPKQPFDERAQRGGRDGVAAGDRGRVLVADVGPHLDQVRTPLDAGHLVGRQVVVDVGHVDQERLAPQESQRDLRPGGVEHDRVNPVAVLPHRLPGPLEHVRRVVAHQVVQPPVVATPMGAIHGGEDVQPGTGLVTVAHAEFDDVQLLGQGAACVQLVPYPEQLENQLPHRLGVAGVTLTAGQRLFVFPSGGLLPPLQRLPVKRVESPDAAFTGGHPRLQDGPRRARGVSMLSQSRLNGRRHVGVAAAAQVHGYLQGGLAGRRLPGAWPVRTFRQYRPASDRLGKVVPVLDPVADHAELGQVDSGGGPCFSVPCFSDLCLGDQGVDERPEDGRNVHRGRTTQLRDRADVNVHGCSPDWVRWARRCRLAPRRPAAPGCPRGRGSRGFPARSPAP